jgi:copper chaperone CopZ
MKYLYLHLVICTVLLIGCGKKENADPLSKVETVTIALPTIVCDMCVKTITKATYAVEGVRDVEVSVEKKSATVTFVPMQTNIQVIESAISEAGYDANGRKRNEDAYNQLPDCCKHEG